VTFVSARTRYVGIVLLVSLLACLAVAFFRLQIEDRSKRVELAIDFQDFAALARSYDYNPAGFLVALRRAGLTSLALTEELGANVGDDGKAQVLTGASLRNQAQIAPIRDPLLAGLVASKRIEPGAVYLLVDDRLTYDRYRLQLGLHFAPRSVRVLRATRPWLIEVRTQIDYFNTTSLGIPTDEILLARKLGLLVIPRLQNDERYAGPQMAQAIDAVLRFDPRVSTLIFFGLRNQVMGFPDHLEDMAAIFKEHRFNFGSIETYDQATVQKGNDGLAELIPGRTVRVQAIAKTELDKIKLDVAVARYVLGVRERNVRVVYLRPWDHRDGDRSIERTNVDFVAAIASQLKSSGYRLGRATPIAPYRGNNRIIIAIAALAVPSIFLLLLDWFGWYRRNWAIVAYGLTILAYAGGVVSHHDLLVRSLLALAGALLFATAAFAVLAPAFRELPAADTRTQILRSLGWMLAATGVALLGALVVVGLLSSPLTMEEIERFRGVKLVLALPPLIALLMYAFDSRYGVARRPRELFASPVLAYQLLAGLIVVGGAAVLVMRSGNDSDISPSQFELTLRHVLTNVLSVRPRFKEFLIGVPSAMLVAALAPLHRRWLGWLLALGAGVGIGDVIDTFSHLHTPLAVSLLRIANGVIIGAIIGSIVVLLYRRFVLRRAVAPLAAP
jgi:hypothetical protein